MHGRASCEQIPTGGPHSVSLYIFQARCFCLINLRRTLDRNYNIAYQTIVRVHLPAEPIHAAVCVYRHFILFMLP